jgi:hypothetical protein
VIHLAVRRQQRGGTFVFRDVNPEDCLHPSLLSVASCAVSLVHAGYARQSGLRYRSTGRHTVSAGR